MNCTIFLPFSLFLSFSFFLLVSYSHTTLTFMHSHICSSSLQMIMCLSTAECAVCQCRAWGQCFSRRTSKVVISNLVYAYPEGRRRPTHIKLNGRNCGTQYGGYGFHFRVKRSHQGFFCLFTLECASINWTSLKYIVLLLLFAWDRELSQRSTIWYHRCLILFLILNMLL